jgi:hypothetical protein
MNKYRFISDPGHGWLEVPIAEINRLKISGKISNYSYKNGEMAYLEEDCDASLFMKAKLAQNESLEFFDIFQENTPIRGYRSFHQN